MKNPLQIYPQIPGDRVSTPPLFSRTTTPCGIEQMDVVTCHISIIPAGAQDRAVTRRCYAPPGVIIGCLPFLCLPVTHPTLFTMVGVASASLTFTYSTRIKSIGRLHPLIAHPALRSVRRCVVRSCVFRMIRNCGLRERRFVAVKGLSFSICRGANCFAVIEFIAKRDIVVRGRFRGRILDFRVGGMSKMN